MDGATIQLEGDEISEIHVLTHSKRPPKQIVRDVQTVLMTLFNRSFDYRVVSVAYTRGGDTAENGSPESAPAPEPAAQRVTQRPAGAAMRDDGPEFETSPAERIRFASVNLFVSGPRTQAQVELRWKGLSRMGSAAGWSTRDGAHHLIAQATLSAVQEFLESDVAFNVQGVDFVRMGRRRVALVALSLLAHRSERALIGSCAVEQDTQQAVVLATLAALNRVVGGLPTREPTEYVLRPTST